MVSGGHSVLLVNIPPVDETLQQALKKITAWPQVQNDGRLCPSSLTESLATIVVCFVWTIVP